MKRFLFVIGLLFPLAAFAQQAPQVSPQEQYVQVQAQNIYVLLGKIGELEKQIQMLQSKLN